MTPQTPRFEEYPADIAEIIAEAMYQHECGYHPETDDRPYGLTYEDGAQSVLAALRDAGYEVVLAVGGDQP